MSEKCSKCGLKAETLLSRFCTHKECPQRMTAMQSQMMEDFSDPTFERSLAQIRDVDRHMRRIRELTAALKAARAYIETSHDVLGAVEAGKLLYAIDSALGPSLPSEERQSASSALTSKDAP